MILKTKTSPNKGKVDRQRLKGQSGQPDFDIEFGKKI
jgi:hypothetical protein